MGKSFLAFKLSAELVWTACSTMGLLPTGVDGKPAPELKREGRFRNSYKKVTTYLQPFLLDGTLGVELGQG